MTGIRGTRDLKCTQPARMKLKDTQDVEKEPTQEESRPILQRAPELQEPGSPTVSA